MDQLVSGDRVQITTLLLFFSPYFTSGKTWQG